MLKNDHGHIVTISSVAGLAGNPGMVDYCASKYATVGLTESLYMEIKRKNSKVKCTLICPFLIATGMFEGMTNQYSWLIPTGWFSIDIRFLTRNSSKTSILRFERGTNSIFDPKFVENINFAVRKRYQLDF